MITGISKKVIFITLFFINFTQSLKSADLLKINHNKSYSINKLGNLKLLNTEKQLISKNFIKNIERINSSKKSLEKKILPLFAYIGQSHNELIIESDKQYEINGVIYAEGNVSLTHQGKLLRADNLIFDKLNKTLIAEGNISLVFGKQMFKMAKFEYNFLTEKGYLLDVKGSINTKNLISDLNSDFSSLCSKIAEQAFNIADHQDIGFAEIQRYINVYAFDEPMFYQTSSNGTNQPLTTYPTQELIQPNIPFWKPTSVY